MIHKLLCGMLCVTLSVEARADDEEQTESTDVLSPYRMPFAQLAEHSIGTASKSVVYNWRRSPIQVGGSASLLSEMNNFRTKRVGAVVRKPREQWISEFSVNYVRVRDTSSSSLLALTPYRQAGRPSRLEFDFGLAYPLAEGVVTAAPRLFPSVQMVFNAHLDLRYQLYPTGFKGMRTRDVFKSVLLPSLSQAEVDNLEGARLDAMQVDPTRYQFLLGFGEDLYFKKGVFVSPRVMVAIPLPGNRLLGIPTLGFWTDLTLVAGLAF